MPVWVEVDERSGCVPESVGCPGRPVNDGRPDSPPDVVGRAEDVKGDVELVAPVLDEAGLCPGPTGAVWRWNLTYVQRYLRCIHFPQGLHPSQGKLPCTHWSQDCLLVVARLNDVDPFRLPVALPPATGFSFA